MRGAFVALGTTAWATSAVAQNAAETPVPWTPWAILGWVFIVLGPVGAGAALAESKKGLGGGILLTVVGLGIAAANGGLEGDGRALWLPVAILGFALALGVTWLDRLQKRIRMQRRQRDAVRDATAGATRAADAPQLATPSIEDKYIMEGAKSFPVVGIPTLYVRYQKASGEEVEHEIDVTRIALEDGEIARMTAKRKDAAGLRTFLLPRVQEVAIAATGEVVDDLEGMLRAGAERAMK